MCPNSHEFGYTAIPTLAATSRMLAASATISPVAGTVGTLTILAAVPGFIDSPCC